MTSEELFKTSDEARAVLSAYAEALFSNVLTVMPFDEINMPKIDSYIKPIFKQLDAQCRKIYADVIKNSYGMFYAGDNKRKEFSEAATSLLTGVNAVTQYQYTSEWERKEARLKEAISVTHGSQDRRKVVQKTVKLLEGQIAQYADNAVVAGMMLAFTDMGVREVEFHTQHDNKVCEDCAVYDGEIFPKDEAPQLPLHYHCRCYYTAVKPE